MTLDEAIPDLPGAIGYLFTAYRQRLDDASGLVYEHQLADVPLPLVRQAVVEAPRRFSKPFLPSISELRALCETIRVERTRATPFEPCVACRELTPGWDVVVDPDGTKRYMRCACWRAYWARLETIGVTGRPIMLLTDGDDR